jgi:oligoribonuclease NrnB/cAMP/cGMP phosphodiesterase (DHH superfamily)
MHLAMQFAKIDAKKLWKEQKELKESEDVEEEKEKINGDNSRKMKASQGKGVKKTTRDTRRPNVCDSQFFPNSDENVGSEEKQAREVRRLEKQIQNYLQRLDDLIHKVDFILCVCTVGYYCTLSMGSFCMAHFLVSYSRVMR